MYRENSEPTSALKGDMPLMGSAVSLMSAKEAGKYYCFRLVSGVTSLVMQAESLEEMMEWASTLYHASFIANGGNHIVGLQRARASHQKKKEEETALKAQAELINIEALRVAEVKKLEEDVDRLKLEDLENKRRLDLDQVEVDRLEKEDEAKRIIITDANNTLKNATNTVKNTKPMTLVCIDALKIAINTCKNLSIDGVSMGVDAVAVLEAELVFDDTMRVFEEQMVSIVGGIYSVLSIGWFIYSKYTYIVYIYIVYNTVYK